jgi:Ca2+-binding EF-hand superfamily protein
MGFDTNKWFKQQYFSEAGIILESELVKALNQAIPDNTGYKEFAQAVATILKDEYGSQNFGPFMDVLHSELGIKPLNEEAEEYSKVDDLAKTLTIKYPELRFIPNYDRIDVFGDENDKVGFANAVRDTDFGDGYRMFDVEDDDRGYMVRIVKDKK